MHVDLNQWKLTLTSDNINAPRLMLKCGLLQRTRKVADGKINWLVDGELRRFVEFACKKLVIGRQYKERGPQPSDRFAARQVTNTEPCG